ncbi:uncharacterized protein [Rutidosis leptorrhynchoides]|uniref:uncharacterized protein n=1 Tax=Rutidosis leptorrhynchoides TaxID=125765 RepID=UPI003A997361
MAGDEGETSNKIIDITSPYYLNFSDHPGMNFVGDSLLHDGNYNGSIPMPAEGSTNLASWKRCNAMVRGWLVSSMENELKNNVKYAAIARDIWVDLKEWFDKENAPRAYELRRTITSVHQENMTVSAYYTKLRGIWDEIQSVSPSPLCTCNLCTCNLGKSLNDMRDKEKLYDFLMGLNEEYSSIRSRILSNSPLPSLVAAFHMVNQDEQQKKIGTNRVTNMESSAFQAFGKKQQGRGNNWVSNKRDERENRGSEECTYCQKTGHTVDGCFELIGYPDWWSKKAAGSKNQTNRFKDQPKAVAVHNDKQAANLSREDVEQLLQLLKATDELFIDLK